ncbi:succinylglutamate-semialdehyde dehydrogenase [Aurantiacibacter gangjinensis]|uniref:Succinylglutamate-semialdehyde dehydrogenase n=1 Tax=Aurantiacibacter gangjinensis TaxID=502682 RepID=A0A0G9MS68_9SPHN|nr:succinylglutamate-semialdehyde dehydrogenase [Aurantiacibacter gangjinensis]APE28225.1 Succinylglutamic semialdehyde dehydrogenase [Aurantiacibacter gangjinensis]KLE32123.1 succinylglutamate-semialdehyde dehydrogenase [Aurantiacibacter gangjinensis]
MNINADRDALSDTAELISYEPATGAELWRQRHGNVDEYVARARKAWPGWAAEPLAKRIELVRRFVNEVRAEQDEFAQLISRETGKPLWEARTEVEAVMAKVDISITAYAERTGQRKLDSALQGSAALRHKPHGVMAVLGPYNFPAHLPNGHIVPALIAGNAIILKPSEKTPAVGERLLSFFHKAGIPQDVVQCLIGGPDEGKALVAHADVDGVLFTGSAQVGIAINRKLASNPGKMVALEMGGNNPIVLWDTPKLEDAAALIIQSAFTTAGQRCTAGRRLIVKSSMYDAALEAVTKLTDRLLVDEPFADPAPFMGPVIDNQTADQLTESFLYLLSNGGKAIKHLRRPHGDLPFLSPSIIDTTNMAERPDVELFGPILQVVRVDDFDAAIAEANNTRFGLSASLIGGDPKQYNRFWANIRAGIVNWNRPTNGASSAAPFGGIGLSGNHRPAAFYAADYCAYPVTSTELEQPRASVGVGFKDR